MTHLRRMKQVTLALLWRRSGKEVKQVLLGMKKRGHGMGKWNGFGGKVEESDASVAAAAAREIEEECRVVVREQDLEHRGVLRFSFENSVKSFETHIYIAEVFTGEPMETEEMRPHWYSVEEIPYDEMWTDDKLWLPHILQGKSVDGEFHFEEDEATIISQHLEVIDTPKA